MRAELSKLHCSGGGLMASIDYDRMAADVTRTLELLHEPGSVVEIRALGCQGRGKPHQASGNFQDFELAGREVAKLDREFRPLASTTP